MSLNISNLRSQLVGGGAKASHFQVQITNPVTGAADLKVPFLVKASSLPGTQSGTIEVPYFGRKIKLAGDRTYPEWTVTVINDEDFLIRNAMEQWMNAINSPEGNIRRTGSSSPSEYKTQAQVWQYSKTGEVIREISFEGLFPTDISEIEVSWETTDAIEEFTVTFQYDWHYVSGGITGNAGGQ